MNIKNVVFSIQGTTPLLLNNFTDAAQLAATSGSSSAIRGDKGTPLEQATTKLYRSSDGKKLIVPQPNFFRCIIDAGKFFKAGKSKITTQKSSLIPACVEIQGIELLITHKEPWTVDTRAVRIPSTGGRILCYRPCFHDWKLENIQASVDIDMLPLKLFRELLDSAGRQIGLGDFRPDCKGPFGKFCIVKWEEEKEAKGKKAA